MKFKVTPGRLTFRDVDATTARDAADAFFAADAADTCIVFANNVGLMFVRTADGAEPVKVSRTSEAS